MDLAEYSLQNPWWKERELINADKHIKEYQSKKYRWAPSILNDRFSPGNIYTLRGPRQVGKTTLIKLIIRSLLEEGVPEKAVFYATCDALVDRKELLELINAYLRFKAENEISPAYIFLDEISGIPDWQKTIKYLADTGALGDVALLLTGSHTLDVKYGTEFLPGRTGSEGKDYLLLPLSFREFIEVVRPEIHEKIPAVSELSIEEFNRCASLSVPFSEDLRVLFAKYLRTGGFMLPINEYLTQNEIPEYVYEIYSRWVIGDIAKWGKQEKILKQVLRTALKKQGTSLSWDSFAKEAEIKSHATVSSYIEDLENLYVLFVQYHLDLTKKIPDFNKNKKISFFDPFIYHLFNRLFYFREHEINPSLVEAVSVIHFARYFKDLCSMPGRSFSDFVFYHKNRREADIVVKTWKREEKREGKEELGGGSGGEKKEELLALEVKYQNKIIKDDRKSLLPFGKGVIISKDTLKPNENYPVIPVHMLLASIE